MAIATQKVKNLSTPKGKLSSRKAMVTIPLKEYQLYLEMIAAPVVQLKGKAARDLDRLYDYGMREYAAGRARKIRSLADLD